MHASATLILLPSRGVLFVFEHVVVPLDGSALAEAALPPAADLARACGARLVLVSVVDAPAAVQGRCRELDERAPTLDVPDVGLVVRHDLRPSTAIAEAATASGSIVCMATHGRSGIGRAVLGSVAEATLEEVAQPMLLVGRGCPAFASPIRGEVLAWVEPGPSSGALVGLAAQWAGSFGQRLEIVQVGGDREAIAVDADEPTPGSEDRLPPGVGVRVLAGRRPARAAASVLDEHRPGVVVLGTERRRGLTRPLAGLPMRVIHDAPCPALLVPLPPST